MTAAEHRIIIEKGADFSITVTVEEGIGTVKDLSGFTASMTLKFVDITSTSNDIKYIDSNGNPVFSGAEKVVRVNVIPDPTSGIVRVTIDKSITAKLSTLITKGNRFSTEYNYLYNIDLNNATTGEDLRVLRGNCAVRE